MLVVRIIAKLKRLIQNRLACAKETANAKMTLASKMMKGVLSIFHSSSRLLMILFGKEGIYSYALHHRNIFKCLPIEHIMLKIKKLSEVIGLKVFTDAGDLFGMVEEINLVDNKIDGWRIVVSRDSGLVGVLGGARGIIVPHQFIKAIGDVIIINKNAVPVKSMEEDISFDGEEEQAARVE
jgi:sporulation protein YlmC with PRC-barrel domain